MIDRNAAIGLFAVLVVALIIVAVVAVMFIPWKAISIDEKRNVAKIPGIEQMIVTIASTAGHVDVSFGDLSDDLAQFSVEGAEHVTLFTENAQYNLNFSASPSIDGKTMNIQADVWFDNLGIGLPFSNLTTRIVLDRSIPSYIGVQSTTGLVSLTTSSGVTLNGAYLQATTGGVTMTLAEGTNLTGHVSLITTTGAVALNWNSVVAMGATQLTLDATTGAVEANVTQHVDLGGNVTFSAITTTGVVSWTMNISDGNAARIQSASGFDNVNVQRNVGFTGSNNDLSSANYPNTQGHKFDIGLSVNTGSINLNLQYATV